MIELPELLVKIKADPSGIDSGTSDAMSELSSFGEGVQDIGKKATVGLTLPLVGAGLAAVDMASDLNESSSKVDVVFGDMSASIKEWSETSATSFGQSQKQALDAVGTYGNLFRSMDIGADTSAKMSVSLVELAGDLASFNNLDPTDVLNKLQSGVTGQTEPLKALGVNINAAAVEAKAMALGLAKEGEELTAAAKAQASYALIMEQTKLAQGDFSRTSDGLANSTRIAKAELSDITAELGAELLPIAVEAARGIGDLLHWFRGLSPEVKQTIVVVAGVVATIGPLLSIVGTAITVVSGLGSAFAAVSAALPAIGAAIAFLGGPITLIVAAVAGLALAWANDWGGIREKTGAVVDWIGNKFEGLSTWFSSSWSNIRSVNQLGWSDYKSMSEGAMTGFESFLGIKKGTIAQIFTDLWTWIKSSFAQVDWIGLGSAMINGIVQGLQISGSSLIDAVTGAASGALDAAKGFLGIHSPSTKAADEIGKPLMQGIMVGVEKESSAMRFDGMFNSLFSQPKSLSNMTSIPITINISGSADGAIVGRAAEQGVLSALRAVGMM